MSKKFSKEFSGLANDKGWFCGKGERLFPCNMIQEHCVDKQRIRDVVNGVDSYMTEQHTIMNDMDISEEFKRGWNQATREIEHRLKKKLGLEE